MNVFKIRAWGLCGVMLGLFLMFGTLTPDLAGFGDAVTFSCGDSEETIAAKGGDAVSADGRSIYIGYQQVSSNNQNPILISFVNGTLDWCRTDLETSNDDSRGYGLVWDGSNAGLYAAFTVTGTQGESGQDFRRFATNGWLRSYTDGSPGGGGGPKASIIARIDPETGEPNAATFVTARLSSGKTNSLTVDQLVIEEETVSATARSFYSPRNPDKSAMTCSGASPFGYVLYLSRDLSTALYATADRCEGNSPAIPVSVSLSPQIGFVGENRFVATVSPADAALPLIFTWSLNGTVVREATVESTTDQLSHTWSASETNQSLQVSVTNAVRQDLGLDRLSSPLLTFDVVSAETIYMPLVSNTWVESSQFSIINNR